MASDGLNILYSTIEDPKRDHIAYCYLDDTNSNYGEIDPSQVWHQPPIVDIVWWNNIKKFICATKNGIYSVEYLDQRFKIFSVISNLRVRACVAANTDHLWIHAKDKIYVYDINFQLVKSINFKMPQSLTSPSFCLTDNLVAFILIRRVNNNRYISHIEFYDFNMKRMKRVRLESSETVSMIRTDGNDRFYVAVGQQRFYIIAPNGTKQTINLGKQASCLAVINSQNIVLTKNSRSDLELVRC
ncbi:unnamed protein product [Rotaria socialis]|uniref:Uncharacterized protein n=1 Tax=Rotaria socialis TaxID=392032 RepID=A0A820SHA6_9BILA|nr:unnamed protein product [Rotaria socialis]CAF3369115.1 unnamed protein product [Rotaria socialis]CAF4264604.1 unnamed protein product [Rotaria socialis]CAF4452631.1 unnamed protein product [Rotaria socialis]